MAVNCSFLLLVLVLCCGFIVLRADPLHGPHHPRCDHGWRFFDGSCYYRAGRRNQKKSWDEAQNFCKTMHANLVTVNNADEQNFLGTILGRKGSWCGLYRNDHDQLVWVSGQISYYRYWAPKQPKYNINKRCVHMQWRRHDHKWVMQQCAQRRRFTCEKKAYW